MNTPQQPDGAAAMPGAFPDEAHENALSRVKAPAIILIVLWAISILTNVWGVLSGVIGSATQSQQTQMIMDMLKQQNPNIEQQLPFLKTVLENMTSANIAASVFGLILCALGLIGAIKMLQLKTYGLALAGAILAVIPCFTTCCCLLGIPFGIWALVVLGDRSIRQQFS